jgi:putative GTP pyrophosphokinase
VTDLIAVRVITYFGHDIDRIERELQAQLEVSERKSRDARKALAEDRFGYRSVHLIARLRRPLVPPGRSAIRRRWFEVQIRSILDHAWSEIEHEAVYKSGVMFPSRTIHSCAG